MSEQVEQVQQVEQVGQVGLEQTQTVEALRAELKEAQIREATLKRENAAHRIAQRGLQEEVAGLKTRVGDEDRIALLEAQVESQRDLQERYTQTEAALTEFVEAQIKGLPKDVQKIVKGLPGSMVERAAWLSKSIGVLQKPQAPDLQAGAASIGGQNIELDANDLQIMQNAELEGVPYKDKAEYLEAKRLARERYIE